MSSLFNQQTTAAVVLLSAGVIHNYSFMCRKLPPGRRKGYYPTSTSGKFLFNLSWMCLAGYGFLLCSKFSAVLFGLAAAIYFLLFPFLLQPQLARLLGFGSLREYVATVDQANKPTELP